MECRQEAVEAPLHVIWVYALDPSCAHFLLHGSASELEPRFVEVIAKAIRSGHPNQHRSRIGHCLEARLAFPQLFFRTLLLCNVSVHRVIRNLIAGSRNHGNSENGDTNLAAIFAPANALDLQAPAVLEHLSVLSGARHELLRNDEVINGTFHNLLLPVAEQASEFHVDADNAIVGAQNNGRFRALFKQLVQPGNLGTDFVWGLLYPFMNAQSRGRHLIPPCDDRDSCTRCKAQEGSRSSE